MDEPVVAHLAGFFDGVGSITVMVSKNSDYATGYRVRPLLRIHRSADDEALLGMIDAYCDEHAVRYSLTERHNVESDSLRWVVEDTESIRRFLSPLTPYLISKREAAALMLEEVIPRIEDGKGRTEDGILELMPYIDRLRDQARYGTEAKYDEQYFKEQFA